MISVYRLFIDILIDRTGQYRVSMTREVSFLDEVYKVIYLNTNYEGS